MRIRSAFFKWVIGFVIEGSGSLAVAEEHDSGRSVFLVFSCATTDCDIDGSDGEPLFNYIGGLLLRSVL